MKTQTGVYHNIMNSLIESQNLKKELLPYLMEHYPHLLQRKSRLERIRECSNAVSFRRYIETGEVRLLNSNFCKYDRICLACAVKRSMKMLKKYTDNIISLGLEKKHRYMITLTIRHNKYQSLEYLLDRVFGLRDQIARRFRNSKREHQKNKSFFSLFDGLAIATEITCNMEKSGRHPHIHILACSNKEIAIDFRNPNNGKLVNKELYHERLSLTKDSHQAHIKPLQVEHNQYSRLSLGEVFKYACKFSELPVDKLAEIMNLQHKHQYRFFASYGIFRGWKIQDSKQFHGDRKDGEFLWDGDEYNTKR